MFFFVNVFNPLLTIALSELFGSNVSYILHCAGEGGWFADFDPSV